MPQSDQRPMSSYVILGLLETCGPMTSYELKKTVATSVGYFWDFPRAQLYVDPDRMVNQGLLDEEREAEGRRRRTFRITDLGRSVLRAWLQETQTHEVELRDTGLLKLYFGFLLESNAIVQLAQREAAMHRQRQHDYDQIAQHLAHVPEGAFALATVHLGQLYENMAIQFWDDISLHPPTTPSQTHAKQPSGVQGDSQP